MPVVYDIGIPEKDLFLLDRLPLMSATPPEIFVGELRYVIRIASKEVILIPLVHWDEREWSNLKVQAHLSEVRPWVPTIQVLVTVEIVDREFQVLWQTIDKSLCPIAIDCSRLVERLFYDLDQLKLLLFFSILVDVVVQDVPILLNEKGLKNLALF